MSTGLSKYAVAIRDKEDLWLHKRITRDAKGNIYVLWPIGRSPEAGVFHASYHADGRQHIKTDNKKNKDSMPLKPRYLPRPDVNFRGCQGIVMNPLSLNETRRWGTKCNPADFDAVFEISSSDLLQQELREERLGDFQLEVSVVEADRIDLIERAFSGPLQVLVRCQPFTDRIPWTVVSVVRMM